MPRIQVYLPADLYKELKAHKLPASELFQQAVRVALRRRNQKQETQRYIAELRREVGEPTAEEWARADDLVRRVVQGQRRRRRTG